MKWIKLYESWEHNDYLNREDYPKDDEIIDYFLDKVDQQEIDLDQSQSQEVLHREYVQLSTSYYHNRKIIYFKNQEVDKYKNRKDYETIGPVESYQKEKDADNLQALVYLKVFLPHPRGIRGNLSLDGYTIDILQHYFKKFVMRSGYMVNIIVSIKQTNIYVNPLSESIVRIEFLGSPLQLPINSP